MSEDLLQYMYGFQDGASGRPYPKRKVNHPEYLKGHGDGTKAWNDALAAARIRLKEPSLSYECGEENVVNSRTDGNQL